MSRYAELVFNLPVRGTFTYSLAADSTAAVGYRVSAPFGARKLTGLVVAERDAPPEGVAVIKEAGRVIDSRPVFNEQVLSLARWISRMYMCSLGEALSAMIPGGRRETEPEELPPDEEIHEYELAGQQNDAIRAIVERGSGSFYLFGVTGSGKTDVFMKVARGGRLPREGRHLPRSRDLAHAPGGPRLQVPVQGSAGRPALIAHPFAEAHGVGKGAGREGGPRHRGAKRDLRPVSDGWA